MKYERLYKVTQIRATTTSRAEVVLTRVGGPNYGMALVPNGGFPTEFSFEMPVQDARDWKLDDLKWLRFGVG